MNETKVINIREVNPSRKDERLFWGFNIDSPQRQTQIEGDRFSISGWVLGKPCPAATVEVLTLGIPIAQATVNSERADIAKAYPQVNASGSSGFSTEIAVTSLPAESELILIAVLEDKGRYQIARIQLQHTANQEVRLSPEAEAKLQKSRSRLQELQTELERSRARLQEMQVETSN